MQPRDDRGAFRTEHALLAAALVAVVAVAVLLLVQHVGRLADDPCRAPGATTPAKPARCR